MYIIRQIAEERSKEVAICVFGKQKLSDRQALPISVSVLSVQEVLGRGHGQRGGPVRKPAGPSRTSSVEGEDFVWSDGTPRSGGWREYGRRTAGEPTAPNSDNNRQSFHRDVHPVLDFCPKCKSNKRM